MSLTHDTIVILVADKAAADAFWEAKNAGPNTFVAPLTTLPGPVTAEATHLFASAQFGTYFPDSVTEFQAAFPSAQILSFVGTAEENSTAVNEWLTQINLQRQEMEMQFATLQT